MKKVLLIIMVVMLLVGCSENPLEGSWFDETTGQMMTFEGKECSFSGETHPYKVKDETIIMTVDGEEQIYNFKIEDDILEISFPDLDDFELYFKKIKRPND